MSSGKIIPQINFSRLHSRPVHHCRTKLGWLLFNRDSATSATIPFDIGHRESPQYDTADFMTSLSQETLRVNENQFKNHE